MSLKPTQERGLADEVIYVPTAELADVPPLCARPNARRVWRGAKGSRQSRASAEWSPGAPCSLYDGHEGLLVRTALLRSSQYANMRALPIIDGPEDVAQLVRHVGYSDQEHIVVLPLNKLNQVTAIYEAAIGPTDHAAIETRTIVKIVILTAAISAVMVHNHPSGIVTPSRDDIRTTQTVIEALECFGYTLMDHVIVSHGKHASLRELGLID